MQHLHAGTCVVSMEAAHARVLHTPPLLSACPKLTNTPPRGGRRLLAPSQWRHGDTLLMCL